MSFYGSSPATVNHREQAQAAALAAVEVFGPENVLRDFRAAQWLGGLLRFLLRKPGAYVLLGQGGVYCHHPEFDFNDDVLPLGVRFFVELALARLAHQGDTA